MGTVPPPQDRSGWPFLPALLFDMAMAFGLDTALRFAKVHGGGYLYVPTTSDPESPLGREWGVELLAFLVGRHPGERITVPQGPGAEDGRQRAEVRRLTLDGLTATEIGRKLGVHVRTVCRIRRAIRDVEGPSALPLTSAVRRKPAANGVQSRFRAQKVAQRRADIEALMVQGLRQCDIARCLGIGVSTVANDIKALRDSRGSGEAPASGNAAAQLPAEAS